MLPSSSAESDDGVAAGRLTADVVRKLSTETTIISLRKGARIYYRPQIKGGFNHLGDVLGSAQVSHNLVTAKSCGLLGESVHSETPQSLDEPLSVTDTTIRLLQLPNFRPKSFSGEPELWELSSVRVSSVISDRLSSLAGTPRRPSIDQTNMDNYGGIPRSMYSTGRANAENEGIILTGNSEKPAVQDSISWYARGRIFKVEDHENRVLNNRTMVALSATVHSSIVCLALCEHPGAECHADTFWDTHTRVNDRSATTDESQHTTKDVHQVLPIELKPYAQLKQDVFLNNQHTYTLKFTNLRVIHCGDISPGHINRMIEDHVQVYTAMMRRGFAPLMTEHASNAPPRGRRKAQKRR
ncbi:hypothetical protein B0I35DRAFT_420705 [Stachybotrys elegans]|uniref:Uncharacterized protein n=1 Tax=Stachybotrys elegans TaxID=80388 RepID=A0A8K0T3E9_9HYPO|nr:hypothetical protein B0I35DRAFT_420705 [Stachybotrys elegans]